MTVNADQVARVVAEVSAGSDEDPQRVASLVGAFMQRQPMIGHYVSSFQRELGLEGMVLTLLHAHVLARCLEIAGGRRLSVLQAAELDAATRAPAGPLTEEPELETYLTSNIPVDDATLGKNRETALSILRLVARALLRSR